MIKYHAMHLGLNGLIKDSKDIQALHCNDVQVKHVVYGQVTSWLKVVTSSLESVSAQSPKLQEHTTYLGVFTSKGQFYQLVFNFEP
jgi:hypothetical protein